VWCSQVLSVTWLSQFQLHHCFLLSSHFNFLLPKDLPSFGNEELHCAVSVLILALGVPRGTPRFDWLLVYSRHLRNRFQRIPFPCVPYQQTGVADLCQTIRILVIAGTYSFTKFSFLAFRSRAKRNRQKHLQGTALQRNCLPLWQEWGVFFLFFQSCVELRVLSITASLGGLP